MDTTNLVRLGSLSACIASDYRYTDTVRVYLDPTRDVAIVTVSVTGAVGGMDGPGGATNEDVRYKAESQANPKAKDVLEMIKRVTTNEDWNFKKYGKPTKNFTWASGGRGLNAALCTSELTLAREGK